MLALLVAAIGGLFLVHLAQSGMDYAAMGEYSRAQYQRQHMIAVAEGIETFYRERGAFPASLDALTSTAGYEHLKSNLEVNMGYAGSGTLSDGTWQYSRVVAYLVPPDSTEDVTTYPSKNYCGTGPIATAVSWCGDRNSLYFRRETRDEINEELTTQQARLISLQHKFVRYYNAFQKYPDKDGSNTALTPGAVYSIAALVNYTGTAAACVGPFQYQGIPIDCSDIFDKWGQKVAYQFESAAHIILVSESPFFNAAGTRMVVAVDRT